jgi:metallophosphoesterase (TIGR03767 family)
VRTAALLACVTCLLALCGGVAWSATTVDQRIVGTGGSGFRTLQPAPGESYVVRTEGLGRAEGGRSGRRRSLVYFGQLSDFQLSDEESPARVEFLDGSTDPAPFDAAYRPWEALMPQTVEMGIHQVNQFAGASPVKSGDGKRARMDLALTTGDSADNQEKDEVQWVVRLLEGGDLTPNSGTSDVSKYDSFCQSQVALGQLNPAEAPNYTGVQDFDDYAEGADPSFYDPDDPRGSKYGGFPRYPGLMDRAQQSFHAEGLRVPSYVAFGNHDGLVQGNQSANKSFDDVAVGCIKPLTPIGDARDLGSTLANLGPAALQALAGSSPDKVALVPPDPDRTFVSKAQYKGLHATGAQPDAHGFAYVDAGELAASHGAAGYYSWSPKPGVRFIALDTVSEGGVTGPSADGNIDDPQFRWLERELKRATARDELAILFGHHAINSLTADVPDEAAPPCTGDDPSRGHDQNPGCDVDPRSSQPIHLGDDLTKLLHKYPHAAAFVAGHSHLNQILAFPRAGGGGFWNLKLAAEADWPQQSRLIQVMDNRDGTLSIFGTILDHASPVGAPVFGSSAAGFGTAELGSISRMLSFNDPQVGAPHGEGAPKDRNVELLLGDPRRNPIDSASGRRCANVSGKVRGRRFHRARVGERRRTIRRRYPTRRARGDFDYFCLSDGKRVRVGYPSRRLRRSLGRRARRRARGRAALVLTDSPHLKKSKVKVGTRTRTLRRRLRGEFRVRSGRTTFYVGRGRSARAVFRVQRGKVREVGVAWGRLARSRRAAARLLRSYRR